MLVFGYISEVDSAKGLYRVNLEEFEIVTNWISPLFQSTKETKDEDFFVINQHVACMMKKDLNDGVIMGAIYDKKNAPAVGDKDKRHTTFPDSSFTDFNKTTGDYEANYQGDAKFISNKVASIQGTNGVELNGNSNGGLLKINPSVEALNDLEQKINDLITAINGWVVAGGDGGAALKAVLVSWVATPLTLTINSDLENTTVKH